ncbi:MAG: hypothetical protein JXB50_15010 [Spirochaetes bacterium]|nr:hypothetical protein [Spirochaetota bacterium]
MAIRKISSKVQDLIKVQNVLISLFDKSGLETLVNELLKINSSIKFYSTGGTYKKIAEILGDKSNNNLVSVEEYTKFPEMEGGLVKTLHPKIHAGILGERNNTIHEKYLKEVLDNGVYFDLVVINLYPFKEAVSLGNSDIESARGNIDIGGPTMIRAAAKNFLGCAIICSPNDYTEQIEMIKNNRGCTSLEERFLLAQKAFALTADYDDNINKYLNGLIQNNKINEIIKSYK